MKAKNLYCLIALCASGAAFAPSVSAQNVVVEDESVSVTAYTCDDTDRYYQSWRNNWFIQVGAGINQPFVERGVNGAVAPGHAVRRQNMTTTYNFGVGHWVSPYVAFRFNALGGALHWDNPVVANQSGWSKAKHVNLNTEVMWDMFNSFAGVNPNRVFSIVPFAGLGADYIWGLNNDPAPILFKVRAAVSATATGHFLSPPVYSSVSGCARSLTSLPRRVLPSTEITGTDVLTDARSRQMWLL